MNRPPSANAERLRQAGVLSDIERLNPKQQKAIEELSSPQVENLIDLFEHFHKKHAVTFDPQAGKGPASQII